MAHDLNCWNCGNASTGSAAGCAARTVKKRKCYVQEVGGTCVSAAYYQYDIAADCAITNESWVDGEGESITKAQYDALIASTCPDLSWKCGKDLPEFCEYMQGALTAPVAPLETDQIVVARGTGCATVALADLLRDIQIQSVLPIGFDAATRTFSFTIVETNGDTYPASWTLPPESHVAPATISIGGVAVVGTGPELQNFDLPAYPIEQHVTPATISVGGVAVTGTGPEGQTFNLPAYPIEQHITPATISIGGVPVTGTGAESQSFNLPAYPVEQHVTPTTISIGGVALTGTGAESQSFDLPAYPLIPTLCDLLQNATGTLVAAQPTDQIIVARGADCVTVELASLIQDVQIASLVPIAFDEVTRTFSFTITETNGNQYTASYTIPGAAPETPLSVTLIDGAGNNITATNVTQSGTNQHNVTITLPDPCNDPVNTTQTAEIICPNSPFLGVDEATCNPKFYKTADLIPHAVVKVEADSPIVLSSASLACSGGGGAYENLAFRHVYENTPDSHRPSVDTEWLVQNGGASNPWNDRVYVYGAYPVTNLYPYAIPSFAAFADEFLILNLAYGSGTPSDPASLVQPDTVISGTNIGTPILLERTNFFADNDYAEGWLIPVLTDGQVSLSITNTQNMAGDWPAIAVSISAVQGADQTNPIAQSEFYDLDAQQTTRNGDGPTTVSLPATNATQNKVYWSAFTRHGMNVPASFDSATTTLFTQTGDNGYTLSNGNPAGECVLAVVTGWGTSSTQTLSAFLNMAGYPTTQNDVQVLWGLEFNAKSQSSNCSFDVAELDATISAPPSELVGCSRDYVVTAAIGSSMVNIKGDPENVYALTYSYAGAVYARQTVSNSYNLTSGTNYTIAGLPSYLFNTPLPSGSALPVESVTVSIEVLNGGIGAAIPDAVTVGVPSISLEASLV